MPTVWVRLPDRRGYPVIIRSGSLSQLGILARNRVRGKTACLITHPRLQKLYGQQASSSLAAAGFRVHSFLVPEGEKSKNLGEVERLTGRMLRHQLDRTACVVALGGGVIGDLAGFIAATYLRGVEWIQVPTTLLAQVDSAVGGKVAVNHALGKNMIGAFYQPRLVVSDPRVLRTLPARQFRAGLAEVIKSAIIADRNFFAFLERKLPELQARKSRELTLAISRTCAIKAEIVSRDEKEKGRRALLNYGHTIGHALEAYHHYRVYLHGEAIAIGMIAAARLAHQIGLCGAKTVARQESIFAAAGLPTCGKGESVSRLENLMKVDKKSRAGSLNFVLTPQIGHARITNNLTPFSVRQVLLTVVRPV